MAGKRIFLLSSGRLTVHHWSRNRFTARYVFRADEEGLTAFSEYLQVAPADPVYLLVDVVEEEFREETVPHVYGADRRALLRNKKTRLFRDPTYSHALFQGREPGGRRDDRVLFTALIRPDLLAPWLAQMTRLKVPLSGIYSLPVLSELLVKKLRIASGLVLLVTLHGSGGLRQSFFQDGHLKVSRLATVPEMHAARYPAFILGEVEKIRRYLGSLRLIPRDVPLDVHLLNQGGMLEDLKRQASDSVTTRYHFVEIAEVARQIGLKKLEATPYAELVFAHLLAKTSPPNHYAPERERRYFSLQRARGAMAAASALLFLGALGWGGYQFIDSIDTRQETLLVERQIGFYNERLRIAREELPPAPALAHDIKAAVETAERLREYKASPLKLLRVVSGALSSVPEVQVESLKWRVSPDPNAPVEGRGGDRSRAELVAQVLAPDPAQSGAQYHIAHLRGRLEPFGGDYRQALAAVERFADAIAAGEAVESVRPLVLPLNTSSAERLRGTAGFDTLAGAASFELRIVLKAKEGAQTG